MLNDQHNILLSVDVGEITNIYQVGNHICITGRERAVLVDYSQNEFTQAAEFPM